MAVLRDPEGRVRLVALKDLPNGVKAGDAYEERDGVAKFLIGHGLAREAKEPAPEPQRRRYQRRDLQAEE